MSSAFAGYAIGAIGGLAYVVVTLVVTRRARAALRTTSDDARRDAVVSGWVKTTSRAQWALEVVVLLAACVVLSADPRMLAGSGWLLVFGAMFFWLTSGATVRQQRKRAPRYLGVSPQADAQEFHDSPA